MLFFQGYMWLQFKNKTEKPCSGTSLWKVILLYLLNVCVCACCAPAMEREWRSESSWRQAILSFHYVGSGDHIQVIRLSDKFLFSTATSDRHLWKKQKDLCIRELEFYLTRHWLTPRKTSKIVNWCYSLTIVSVPIIY